MAFGKEGNQECTQAPHWMRLLEEKYQRLHAKILNQAAKFTHRRASNITARVLRESRRKQAAGVERSNQTDLGKDQEENPSQFDEAEVNEAARSQNYDSLAQVDCVQSYTRKQTTHSLGQRPQTQDCTRSRVFSDSTQGESSSTITPQSSGVVTRISSAFPRTRLSSAYDVSRQSPLVASRTEDDGNNGLLNSEGHASQLDKALRLELKTQNEGWVVGEPGQLSPVDNPNSWKEEEDGETKSEKMSLQCQTDRTDVDAMARRRRRHLTRPVKTSVSRVSHKTSKSCPAAFGQQGDINNVANMVSSSVPLSKTSKQLPASVVPLTARGIQEGRMRVFARMSLEARHAVDETLKEMKMEEDACKAVPYDNPEADEDVNGNNIHDENDNVGNYNSDHASNSSLRNNVSAPTGDLKDVTRTQERNSQQNYVMDNASSDVSLASSDGNGYATREGRDECTSKTIKTQHSRNSRLTLNGYSSGIPAQRKSHLSTGRRLPQLDQGVSIYQDEFPTPHPLLPSIKRTNLAFREATFEITPPDFDIRFRDIITCQKGDRDTPPLDVRQQSIEKCQQWLVQYTPRR